MEKKKYDTSNYKRTRDNRITIHLNDKELKQLNRKMERTAVSREEFLRRMIMGVPIMEAPPPPLWETIVLMRQMASDIRDIADDSYLNDASDLKLLRNTIEKLNTCIHDISERCMIDERGKSTYEHKPHRAFSDRER